MDVVVRQGDLGKRPAGALAVGAFQDERALSGSLAAIDRATGGAIRRVMRTRDFTGRHLEASVFYPQRAPAARVILIGLGRASELTAQRIREVAALAARRARELGAGTLAMPAHGAGRAGISDETAAQATAEGIVLGHHRFFAYRSEAPPAPLRRVEIVEPDPARARAMRAASDRGRSFAEATCLARDLTATPGQDLTPERLGERSREIARASGARARVLGVGDLERLGMGALLGVGRGSENPPCFIVLERDPGGTQDSPRSQRSRVEAIKRPGRRSRAVRKSGAGKPSGAGPLVVVGKGVTFDTGGISLKPRENMNKMKYDMGGAAAVLGLFSALSTIEPPFPVVGLIPAAENMPDGRALKPGDVLRTLDGTFVEVTNTDAEGRLLLADALAYARRLKPSGVVDLATLTGAIGVALGSQAAGLFSADETLASELIAAGAASGERLWRMPLWDEYRADLRSDTADLVNSSGSPQGGAIVAAVFLKHFARDLPWAHLDIAGTGWSTTDRPHEPRGPTGFGVRLLLEWISRRAADAAGSSS